VVPPTVEQRLTEKGQRLHDVIEAMRPWGLLHPRTKPAPLTV